MVNYAQSNLLEFLIKNRNRSVSRADLLEAVWNGRIVSAATLTHRINAARAAIGDNAYDQRLIRTVAQQGVRFIGTIKEQRTTATPTLTKPHRPSIAVLPFINVSGDPEQDYFADGTVEEIITGLSRVKWLFVTPEIRRSPTKAKQSARCGVTIRKFYDVTQGGGDDDDRTGDADAYAKAVICSELKRDDQRIVFAFKPRRRGEGRGDQKRGGIPGRNEAHREIQVAGARCRTPSSTF